MKKKTVEKQKLISHYSEVQVSQIKIGVNSSRIDLKSGKRKELAKSIENMGLINPITVRKNKKGQYELKAGFRRFDAIKNVLNWKTVYVGVIDKTAKVNDDLLNMVENSQRQDPSEFEFGLLVWRLREKENMPLSKIAEVTGHTAKSLDDWMIAAERVPEQFRNKLVAPGVPNYKGCITPAAVLEIERATRSYAIKTSSKVSLYRWATKNNVSSMNVRKVAKKVGSGQTIAQAISKTDIRLNTRIAFPLTEPQKKILRDKMNVKKINDALRKLVDKYLKGEIVEKDKTILKKAK